MDEIANLDEEIINEAHEKALAIIENAKIQAKKILQEVEDKVKNKKKIAVEKGRKEEELRIQREISKVKMHEKIKLNNLKQSFIEATIKESLEKIKEMVKNNSDEYQRALIGLIVKGGKALEGGELIVQIKEKDLSKINGTDIASEISKLTKNPTTIELVTLSEDAFIGGAVIIKGSLRVDNTIEAILERKQKVIRNKLHKILFEKED
ncbi:MAG: V-type ATP synthase subunit E [Candidatus Hodarchaeales archaeon]